jgi:hypothetical protein
MLLATGEFYNAVSFSKIGGLQCIKIKFKFEIAARRGDSLCNGLHSLSGGPIFIMFMSTNPMLGDSDNHHNKRSDKLEIEFWR